MRNSALTREEIDYHLALRLRSFSLTESLSPIKAGKKIKIKKLKIKDTMKGPIRLVRYDLEGKEDEPVIEEIPKDNCPSNRNDLLLTYKLAEDSVVKLSYDGKLIPWSLIGYMSSVGAVDFQIYRPHQNIKPKTHEDFASDGLIREKVCRLEERISSLEGSMDETALQFKTERDLQLLTKQISFLARRLEEADQSEWIKKE